MDLVYHGKELAQILKEGKGKFSAQERAKELVLQDHLQNIKNMAHLTGKKIITVNDCYKDSLSNYQQTSFSMPNARNYTYGQFLWINPMEVQALSGHGLIKRIEESKGKGFLSSGIQITNIKLTDRENEIINENLTNKNIVNVLSDSLLSSLYYGGDLLFPIFYKDNPKTFNKPLWQLIRDGVIKKNCIDYFVHLDRWNVFVTPPLNPTQKDFENPDYFNVPFLKADVKSTRCCRVVGVEQPGYWGKILNLGWGISHLVLYLQSYYDYEMCIGALNSMVKNMSIVYRKLPINELMASDGLNAVRESIDSLKEALDNKETEDKINHIINFDTIGELGCINREFKEMDTIITLKRQDLCAKSETYEPLIFTIKRGSFSSGDDTLGTLTKQYDSNSLLYNTVARQLKPLAMLLTIDALGASNRILDILQYSKLEFIKPLAVDALEKAKIGETIAEGVLKYGSVNVPVDYALDLMDEYIDNKGMISKELRAKLKEFEEEKRRLTLEKQTAEIESLKAQAQQARINGKEERSKEVEKAIHKGQREKIRDE